MTSARKRAGSGVVRGDRRYHAVAFRLFGHRALCGAGRIYLTFPGPFDPNDRLACGSCALKFRSQRD